MADIITILLGFFRIIFGFLLVLFIPGCAISFVFYPRVADISPITRIVLSCVISIGSTLCAILFLDIVLGVDTTPANSTLIILAMSLLAVLIWIIELIYLTRKDNQKIKMYLTKTE
jgi:uncharacterized membrane protein